MQFNTFTPLRNFYNKYFPMKLALLFISAVTFTASTAFAQDETRVVILGTGTPTPVAERTGPGVAVITNGEAYVFDAGGGMVKRATHASLTMNLPELTPSDIKHLFLTHLHSDHIHDVNELVTSRWWRREQRLSVYGPRGIENYMEHVVAMATIEADIRAAGTPEQLILDREAYRASAHTIEEGIVFENDDISVEAFTVPHGDIRPSFGYKVITHDKTIVISGDTSFSEVLAEKAKGADLLIHEVISGDELAKLDEFWQLYHNNSHTTTQKLAQVANIARPDLLVLYHVLFYDATPESIVAEIKKDYDGPVVMANDLNVF